MDYGLIGERLGHSFSKEIHEKLGYYKYSLLELKKEELSDFILQKNFKAINVTIPYKQAVIPLLDEISPEAVKLSMLPYRTSRRSYLCSTRYLPRRRLSAR